MFVAKLLFPEDYSYNFYRALIAFKPCWLALDGFGVDEEATSSFVLEQHLAPDYNSDSE